MENRICPFNGKPCSSECAWYDEDVAHCSVSTLVSFLCTFEEKLCSLEESLETIEEILGGLNI